MTDLASFKHFKPVLMAEAAPAVRDPRLLMEKDQDIRIYYAPFEYINPKARVAFVGITPGPTQMVNANSEARRALCAGMSDIEAVKAAKDTAAFSGEPMRGNLIRQLEHWGFHEWLGVPSAAAFFGQSRNLVQTTSLLRYPVFVDDADYRGTPHMWKSPLLRQHLISHFVSEVQSLPDAVFVGLGPQVQRVLDTLVHEGILPLNRVIGGMLHPSGNCTYRINYLVGARSGPVPHATNPMPYDEGRRRFRATSLRSAD